MKEPNVLELLFECREVYAHILQQIFLSLDSQTLCNLRLVSSEMRDFVQRIIWNNLKARKILRNRLKHK